MLLVDGKVSDKAVLKDRETAIAQAQADGPWKAAIVRAIKAGNDPNLPSLQQIEANAAYGAMTTSMRVGWRIAHMNGLLSADAYRTLLVRQVEAMARMLGTAVLSDEARETLIQMRQEYGEALR